MIKEIHSMIKMLSWIKSYLEEKLRMDFLLKQVLMTFSLGVILYYLRKSINGQDCSLNLLQPDSNLGIDITIKHV